MRSRAKFCFPIRHPSAFCLCGRFCATQPPATEATKLLQGSREKAEGGFCKALKEECLKGAAYMGFQRSQYAKLLRAEDGMTDDELKAKEEKRKSFESFLERQQKLRQINDVPKAKSLLGSLRNAFSAKSGIVALIQHCTAAHAAEVAAEQNIDVKNVTIKVEKAAVGQGEKVVGYIEAPMASEEEVLVFAQKLEKSCPAARMHGSIEWRRAP